MQKLLFLIGAVVEDRQEEVTSDPGGCFSPHTQSAFMHYSYTSQPGAVSIQISCDGPPPSPVLGLKRKICLVPLLDLAALEDQLGGKREGFGFNMQKDKQWLTFTKRKSCLFLKELPVIQSVIYHH